MLIVLHVIYNVLFLIVAPLNVPLDLGALQMLFISIIIKCLNVQLTIIHDANINTNTQFLTAYIQESINKLQVTNLTCIPQASQLMLSSWVLLIYSTWVVGCCHSTESSDWPLKATLVEGQASLDVASYIRVPPASWLMWAHPGPTGTTGNVGTSGYHQHHG